MAEIRPLRLKQQSAERPKSEIASVDPVAQLWVDNSVAHLDGIFEYLVPDSLSDIAKTGVRVLVPFAGREVEGLIISRSQSSSFAGLKRISSVISPISIVDQDTIDLIAAVSKRWASHPFDIIRSAIPPRSISVEKAFTTSEIEPRKISIGEDQPTTTRTYHFFSPHEDPMEVLAEMLIEKAKDGGVILVLPQEREVDHLEKILNARNFVEAFSRLDGSMPRALRYRNYLNLSTGVHQIVIGARSAIFAPVANLKTIIVYREGSQSHYEVRTPGWNVRDVAILRSLQKNISLIFAGYFPSSEASRLIENGWLELRQRSQRLNITSLASSSGQLLPPGIFPIIRSSLEKGPVLFLTPRKGYSGALLCQKCRNAPTCHCGGKLLKRSRLSPPQCSHCGEIFAQWRCSWCQGEVLYLLARGADRFAEEIGRAFPGFRVLVSTGNDVIDSISQEPQLVIATAGVQPLVKGGYASVVLLEGETFFAEIDLRAQERARETFFYSASLLGRDGKGVVVIDPSHPITAALSRWNPSILMRRELSERLEAKLPPYFRSALLELPESESVSVVNGLKRTVEDGRLPSSTRILGPYSFEKDRSRILLLTSLSDGALFVDLIHEFIRKRSIAKKSSLTVRIDPYSLS